MGDNKLLGSFEEIVLLAILHLSNDAYGASIRNAVGEATGRSVSIGAIYATLDRLERKRFVTSWQGEATPERGGRAKRYFRIESEGRQALYEIQEVKRRLGHGLVADPVGGTA
jgi:PadR family transcriptional regulator, regulatory protein PadR